MAKLFAMEELDAQVDGVEMEVTPEEGEVADVQVEVEQEVADVVEDTTSIEEGMGAADQLEEVQEVVEQAAEEGEGLDPIAAEAIRIAVEAIASRVGANPKTVYALYATENFQSASSRKANTRIALEGVSEFLKDLWKKIKAALTNLWTKVKAFWDKHVSSLGRVKKALESAKKKVGASSGKFKDSAYVEKAPSFLADAFASKNDINKATIDAYISAHTQGKKQADQIADQSTKAEGRAVIAISEPVQVATESADKNPETQITEMLRGLSGEKSIGTAQAPLIGGVWIKYELTNDEDNVTVEVTVNDIEEKNTEIGITLSEKSDLVAQINNTLTVINDSIKQKSEIDKEYKAFDKTMKDIGSALNKSANNADSTESAKTQRKLIKAIYTLNTKKVMIQNKKASLDVKLAKAVLGYTSLCLKNYK